MNIRNAINAVAGLFSKKPANRQVVITHDGNVVGGHVSMSLYDRECDDDDWLLHSGDSILGVNCIFDGSDVGQASMIDGGDDFTKVMTVEDGERLSASFRGFIHCELCPRDVGLTAYVVTVMGSVNITHG